MGQDFAHFEHGGQHGRGGCHLQTGGQEPGTPVDCVAQAHHLHHLQHIPPLVEA